MCGWLVNRRWDGIGGCLVYSMAMNKHCWCHIGETKRRGLLAVDKVTVADFELLFRIK